MNAEQRLIELGWVLPQASEPKGSYKNCVQTGSLLYVSGKGPVLDPPARGKLGRDYTPEQGYEFARLVALDILAAVQLHLGSLNRVAQVVKIQGFINATEDFDAHPRVLDGCSDALVQLFGERGYHARSVLGAQSVRGQLPIIVESIFEVQADG